MWIEFANRLIDLETDHCISISETKTLMHGGRRCFSLVLWEGVGSRYIEHFETEREVIERYEHFRRVLCGELN